MIWNSEARAKLSRLWANAALSTSKIAAMMGGGCTKNAVIGKSQRMGLAYRKNGMPRAPYTNQIRQERERS